jgi:nitrogen fixation/metabolism regulation signal transduction histidine kinase
MGGIFETEHAHSNQWGVIAMSHTPYKRHIYYIDNEFQGQFIIKFCLLVAISSLVGIGLVYWFAQNSTTVAISHGHVAVRTTADYLTPLLTQTVLIQFIIVAIATVAFTLFVSHKIAGPLYRLKMMFKALSQGDVSIPMRLRQGDQLQAVADGYTEAVGEINERLKKAKEALKANNIEEVKKILGTFITT